MPSFEYSDQDEPTQEDDEEDGFSNWMEDTSRRREGHEVSRGHRVKVMRSQGHKVSRGSEVTR